MKRATYRVRVKYPRTRQLVGATWTDQNAQQAAALVRSLLNADDHQGIDLPESVTITRGQR